MATETEVQPVIEETETWETPYDFDFNDFLKREFRFGIPFDRPLCKPFAQGHCPLGNNCPDKHYAPPSYQSVVCKHWMRALCKKGDGCEFLHEYNVRRMPECVNWARHGTCPNGDDCSYQHLAPASKKPSCPHYDRGFCPLGPLCAKRHVRKDRICPFYMAGFCPDGADCKNGVHARFPEDLPKPVAQGAEPEDSEDQAERKQDVISYDLGDLMQQDGGSKYGRGGQAGRGGTGGWPRGGTKRGGFVKRRG